MSHRRVKIEILPQRPGCPKIGSRQQMRVVATYGDALCVTLLESFIDSGMPTSHRDTAGLITTLRPRGTGAGAYEGNTATTSLYGIVPVSLEKPGGRLITGRG